MIKALLHIQRLLLRSIVILFLILMTTYLLDFFVSNDKELFANAVYGNPSATASMQDEVQSSAPENAQLQTTIESTHAPSKNDANTAIDNDEPHTVQAVLEAKRQIIIASGINAKITKFKLESGDRFKRGDVLIRYDCTIDQGRLAESLSRQRVTEAQLTAYQTLSTLDSASNIELTVARENNEQNKAMIAQIRGRLRSCQHIAPWSGRVTRKMASQHEYVQTGRVLMEISSHDPLRAEFLIPSVWLRWLNVGTPLSIYIGETDKTYTAKIVNIFGEVDPVSQSVQAVAEMEKYHEDLLPGMSGRATFTRHTAENISAKGFLGIKLSK